MLDKIWINSQINDQDKEWRMRGDSSDKRNEAKVEKKCSKETENDIRNHKFGHFSQLLQKVISSYWKFKFRRLLILLVLNSISNLHIYMSCKNVLQMSKKVDVSNKVNFYSHILYQILQTINVDSFLLTCTISNPKVTLP